MSSRNPIVVDALEPRRLFSSASPLGINFTEEVNWDSNFSTAVAQLKTMGVKAVRLWFGFTSYDDRPNAWDPSPAFSSNVLITNYIQNMMQRAFQLKRAGFTVLAELQPEKGIAPTSAAQVKGLVRHLMDATETPTSTQPLKDVVDFWEIGNEPDSADYWKPSASNKTTGLKSYVDNYLIPAGQELHAGGDHENVVSGGVSYSAADMKSILDELTAKNAKSVIDYAGIHPYGTYNPSNPSSNPILSTTNAAVSYAKAFGVGLIASEWNVRGYAMNGSQDATWAKAIDTIFKTVIRPNYDLAFYFASVDNYAARSTSSVSARPAGVLMHNNPPAVTPGSSAALLEQYFNTPLVPNEPFYSVFKAWQGTTNPTTGTTRTLSGTVTNVNAGGGVSSIPVYVDLNGDGKQGATEPTGTTTSTGTYTISYSTADVVIGTYAIRMNLPIGVTAVLAGVNVALTGSSDLSNINFTVTVNGNTPSGTRGTIRGLVFGDGDGDGIYNGLNEIGPDRVVYLDANRNKKLDAGEKSVVSDSSGNYVFTGLTPGTYYVTRIFPSGYHLSSNSLGYVTVNVSDGQTVTGINIGSTNLVTPPTPITPPTPTPPPTTTPAGTASMAGKVIAQISKWNAAVAATAWTVFLDTDKDGVRDSDEAYKTIAGGTVFTFTGLAAGTYTLTLQTVPKWKIVTPTTRTFTVTLKTGTVKTGENFVVAAA